MNEAERELAEQSMQRAVDETGRKKIAAACGVTLPATYQWSICPSAHVLAVEAVTGIPRSFLRHDLYPGKGVLGGDQ